VIASHTAVDRARALAARPGRSIIGIAGPPGSGKSTLAAAVCVALGPACVLVPMDGFHLADVVLDALGLRDRKGAPETFDSWGYAALLGRLRRNTDPVVYAPAFERDIEQPVAGAIRVPDDVRLVITEGNYLLHDTAGWSAVHALLDEVWYCELADDVRLQRLISRHVQYGKTAEQASVWVRSVDEPNARLVAATRSFADRVVAVE
jgi:pantothenate kinase